MKILQEKQKEYNLWMNRNKICFEYARKWAELLEDEIDKSEDIPLNVIINKANELRRLAKTDEVTEIIHGMAITLLVSCWKYGEELKQWHNQGYDYKNKGLINTKE